MDNLHAGEAFGNAGNALSLNSFNHSIAGGCALIGTGAKADSILTREDFLAICDYMMNGNPPTDFLLVYRDKDDRPKFAKAKKPMAARRATWSWDTITGRAKSKVGIGFYPWNKDGKTRWGAMDFDAHDGNALRARGLAMAAFEVLHRQSRLYVILGTSGSEGWHLFAFADEFYPVAEWTRLLKQVAALISVEVRPGLCEVFPSEVSDGAIPYGIRAPGTWNPKTDSLGLIVYSSIAPLLTEIKKRKTCPFLFHATNSVKGGQLNDREKVLYRGSQGEWALQFAITQSSSRRDRLKALVHHIFRQVGIKVGRLNAEAQYREANPAPCATLDENLVEFDDLWTWTAGQWHAELSEVELEGFAKLRSDTERDVFRILRSFARKAASDGMRDFPFPVEHVGERVGVSFQHVSKMRKHFEDCRIIEMTAPHIPNRRAARFRWIAGKKVVEPF